MYPSLTPRRLNEFIDDSKKIFLPKIEIFFNGGDTAVNEKIGKYEQFKNRGN